MIDPIRVDMKGDGSVEIANGAFLGHQVSAISYHADEFEVPYWKAGGRTYSTLPAALYASMADAYRYVASHLDEEARDA